MIVDASLVIDAIADAGPRGVAARAVLASQPAAEPLIAPGHFAFEIMSGLGAAAKRPGHPLRLDDITRALADARRRAADERRPDRTVTLDDSMQRRHRHASALMTAQRWGHD